MASEGNSRINGDAPALQERASQAHPLPGHSLQTHPSQAQEPMGNLTGQHNRKTGKIGEKLAARHLESLGYRHVARNLRMGRMGELDLISWAEDGRTLCFVEVKTRSSVTFGTPAEAVDFRKRLRIRKMAELWLNRCQTGPITPATLVRFDVVEVMLSRESHTAQVHHIPDAF